MKEIENQGRKAALETKLAAIQEMIDETNDRLTRIDEDNEFNEMMDKKKVKEVRKQLKELERAQAKLQKEYGKMGKMGLPKNYDEDDKKVMDEEVPVEEDAIDNVVDEVELEEDDLRFEGLNGVHDLKPMTTMNESTLRMQKLAGLITESELKKKLNLNEAKAGDAKSYLESKGLKVEMVSTGDEGDNKASKFKGVSDIDDDKIAYIWNNEAGDKFDDKDYFTVYMPFRKDLADEMKSKLPVLDVGGKSGTYYSITIEKK